MKNKIIISALLGIFLFIPAKAELKLPTVISDHMVLKRNSEVCLWGEGEPNKKVRISPSWTKRTFSVLVGTNGKWTVNIPTAEAGGPYSISFEQGNRITINDVLLGEVWLCSGQSNMEM
ncbi:MAG: sialate O-acetylesterase, partial [Bacteroidales bacterium]